MLLLISGLSLGWDWFGGSVEVVLQNARKQVTNSRTQKRGGNP
jgi:hypothetical protein